MSAGITYPNITNDFLSMSWLRLAHTIITPASDKQTPDKSTITLPCNE